MAWVKLDTLFVLPFVLSKRCPARTPFHRPTCPLLAPLHSLASLGRPDWLRLLRRDSALSMALTLLRLKVG